jgi:cell division septal protein FtsQ
MSGIVNSMRIMLEERETSVSWDELELVVENGEQAFILTAGPNEQHYDFCESYETLSDAIKARDNLT